MNMRAAVRVCVFLLVLALGLPLTGCGEAQKMREYNQGILTAGTAINEATMHFNDAFEAFKREYSAEHRDALIQAAGERAAGAFDPGSGNRRLCGSGAGLKTPPPPP